MRIFRPTRFLTLLVLLGASFTPLYPEDSTAVERARFESGVTESPTPWTDLDFNNNPENFQFAVVTDRTGSPRKGVWEEAMMKLNWLQPEFVMSVGDMIRGTTANAQTNAAEWDEMEGWISALDMPYFYVAGNHDIQAKAVPGRVGYEDMRSEWEKRFGSPFYYFKYKGVLFICLFSNDGMDQIISPEQVDYFRQVLAEETDARWTMVFLHHPLWAYPHDTRFNQIEKALKGRDYTVFAGHTHNYAQFTRKQMNYYVLATTGGGSRLLGNRFGQFDHVAWVTMTDNGPILANLRLDGVLPHDVATYDSAMMGNALYQSSSLDALVYLQGDEIVEKGIAYLSYTNETKEPMRVSGRFFHNHYVRPDPGQIEQLIPPGKSATIPVDLQVVQPFSPNEEVVLEFDTSLSLEKEEYRDLVVSGSQLIPVENSEFKATTLERGQFVDSMELTFVEAPMGARIHYTLDGSKPTASSPIYREPIPIFQSTKVAARMITEDGFSSGVNHIDLIKIEPGDGLLCYYFENDPETDRWNTLPDFSEYQPTLILPVYTFDLDTLARRDEHFGSRYVGQITLPEAGEYTFILLSSDGGEVFLNGKSIVADRLKHPPREAQSELIQLEAKSYDFELQHFQDRRLRALELYYSLNGKPKQPVPFDWFSFE